MTTKTETEQERRDFECFMSDGGKFPQAIERDANGNYVLMQAASSWHVWQARAALQSQVKNDTTLFCDLKTDEEKSTFFLTGRGYETGVIAQAIQNDVAMAYHRCSEYRKELKALQSQEREDAERYRWLRDPCSGAEHVIFYSRGDYGKGLMSGAMLDEAIDHARRVEGEK